MILTTPLPGNFLLQLQGREGNMNKNTLKALTLIELIIAITVVLRDLFNPTLIILAMVVISLLIRQEKIDTIGLKKPKSWLTLVSVALLSMVVLQLFDVGVLMPILNRLTGTTINYSGFANLKGNPSQLLILLLIGWTLAAFGEEVVYRGYFQKLLGELFGKRIVGGVITIGISSLVFGLAHRQQGIIGVVVTAFDAVIFSLLKRRFDGNLWATILAHGIYNTVGIVFFYFMGPIYGLW